MMKHGWDNYVRYAWGKNELRPISKRGHSASIFGAANMGATIVDGLDTLYIMGLHDEFKQGRDWIAENLDFDIVSTRSAFPNFFTLFPPWEILTPMKQRLKRWQVEHQKHSPKCLFASAPLDPIFKWNDSRALIRTVKIVLARR